MQLFIIYIGGSHSQSLIELHDIRFVIADCIEETYDILRQNWWGTPKSLHLDAWGVLKSADGYSIHLSEELPEDPTNKLYFVNLGGYDSTQFTELHKNVFVVAKDEQDAKQKAVQQVKDWESPHKDYLHEVDGFVDLDELIKKQYKGYIHLKKETGTKPFEFICKYTPIGQ